MYASEFLVDLERRGIRLVADGTALVPQPRQKMKNNDWTELNRHSNELRRILAERALVVQPESAIEPQPALEPAAAVDDDPELARILALPNREQLVQQLTRYVLRLGGGFQLRDTLVILTNGRLHADLVQAIRQHAGAIMLFGLGGTLISGPVRVIGRVLEAPAPAAPQELFRPAWPPTNVAWDGIDDAACWLRELQAIGCKLAKMQGWEPERVSRLHEQLIAQSGTFTAHQPLN